MAYGLTELVLYSIFPSILALTAFVCARYACCGRGEVEPSQEDAVAGPGLQEDPQAIVISLNPVAPLSTAASDENPSQP